MGMEVHELSPSLVIGLGGTGKIVLTHLKGYLKRLYGYVPRERIRLLELDIDPEEYIIKIDEEEVKLRKGTEFLVLGGVPLEEVVSEIKRGRYQEFQPWLDPDLSLLADPNLMISAHAQRQAGRFAFHWNLGSHSKLYLYKQFSRNIDELLQVHGIGRRGPNLNIYVISSLCGGTGSGMLIDAGFVLKRIIKGRPVRLTGIFITPSFYDRAPQGSLRANAWAALRELEYFMTTRAEERRYHFIECRSDVEAHPIRIDGRPYDLVYLVDTHLEDGSTLLGKERMGRVLTKALGLLITSRIGDEANSRIGDVENTIFSSLGVVSTVFPTDEVIDWCAAKGAEEIVEEILSPLAKEREEAIGDQVRNFLSRIRWGADELHARLLPKLDPITEDRRLSQGRLEDLLRQGKETHFTGVRRSAEEVRSDRETEARNLLREKYKEERRLLDELNIEDLISGEGPLYSREFLEKLKGSLEKLEEEIKSNLSITEDEEECSEREVSKAETDFKKAGGFLGKDPTSAREGYLDAVQRWLVSTVDRLTWEEVKRLVTSAIGDVSAEIGKIDDALDTFKGVNFEEDAKNARKVIERKDKILERPILLGPLGREREVLEKNLKEIYEENKEVPLDRLRRSVDGGFAQLRGKSLEKFREKLLDWGREAFRPTIKDISLEDWIDKYGPEDPSEYLSDISRYALYMLRTSGIPPDEAFPDKITIIGVEDEDDSIFLRGIQAPVLSRERACLVSTGDPYALTILRTGHGLKLRDFDQREEYLSSFRERMEKPTRPLHTFPAFNLSPEGITKGKDQRKTFALAPAYRIIERVGQRYQFDEKGLSDRGLFDALWAFVHDEELMAEVKEAIGEHESTSDKERLLEELKGFNETLGKVEEDNEWLAQILRNGVRNHMSRI